MINNSTSIFSEFNTLSLPAQVSAYSTSQNIQQAASSTVNTNENKKNNFIKPIALFSVPTAIGTGIGIKAKSIYARLSKDVFQKQYKELDKKLVASFREDEIAKIHSEYIDVLKNKIDENLKGIEKANKILENLKIPYEREEFEGIIRGFESENKKYGEELAKTQKQHRMRYNELIEEPLKSFKDKQLKKLARNKKKIFATGLIGGILMGAFVTSFYSKNKKEKTKNAN